MTTLQKVTMPVLFIGHGSPMNALADNDYTRSLQRLSEKIPKPKAILSISAHWNTNGIFITSTQQPKLIYDFYGFPEKLYKIEYPARGSVELAQLLQEKLKPSNLNFDNGSWGLDHGTWTILKHIYPAADIPVLQLSLDTTKSVEEHYRLVQALQPLRHENILIIGSGNIVHNLREISWDEKSPPHTWAQEFDLWVEEQLTNKNFQALIQDYNINPCGRLSVPTLDHYLPFIYILGASGDRDQHEYIYKGFQNAAISMRSLIFANNQT